MAKLTELIDTITEPTEKYVSKSPSIESIKPQVKPYKSAAKRFETNVFNFLSSNRTELGIANVSRLLNQRIDGIIETESSELLLLEIKYVMNWDNACRCNCQFEQYFKISKDQSQKCKRGIVIFEEFSGDWNRRPDKRKLEKGWHNWYQEHAKMFSRPFPIFLLQFDGKSLKSFPE